MFYGVAPPHTATQPTSPLWPPWQLGYPVLMSTSMAHLTCLLCWSELCEGSCLSSVLRTVTCPSPSLDYLPHQFPLSLQPSLNFLMAMDPSPSPQHSSAICLLPECPPVLHTGQNHILAPAGIIPGAPAGSCLYSSTLCPEALTPVPHIQLPS